MQTDDTNSTAELFSDSYMLMLDQIYSPTYQLQRLQKWVCMDLANLELFSGW